MAFLPFDEDLVDFARLKLGGRRAYISQFLPHEHEGKNRASYFSCMAIPSMYAFNQLSLTEQLGIVLEEGTYLTMRLGEEKDRTNLYHLGSFFAEV